MSLLVEIGGGRSIIIVAVREAYLSDLWSSWFDLAIFSVRIDRGMRGIDLKVSGILLLIS